MPPPPSPPPSPPPPSPPPPIVFPHSPPTGRRLEDELKNEPKEGLTVDELKEADAIISSTMGEQGPGARARAEAEAEEDEDEIVVEEDEDTQ